MRETAVKACEKEARSQKKRIVKLKSKVDTDTRRRRHDGRTSPARIKTKHHAPQIIGTVPDDN